MATSRYGFLDSLAPLCPLAFVVGGLSVLVDVVLQGSATLLSVAVPGWLNVVFGLGGLWVASFGLIGLYPYLAQHARRWAQGGVLTGSVGWLILTVGLGWGLILDLTGRGTLAEGPGLGPQAIITALVLILLSFLAYGIASLRTHRPSRTIGYLLMIPFVSFALLVVIFIGSNVYGTDPPRGVGVVLFGVVAVSIIALGYMLPRDRKVSGGL